MSCNFASTKVNFKGGCLTQVLLYMEWTSTILLFPIGMYLLVFIVYIVCLIAFLSLMQLCRP